MSKVQRMFHYCELEPEEQLHAPPSKLAVHGVGAPDQGAAEHLVQERTEELESIDWPADSSIEFCNASLRYGDGLPLSLSDVTFRVEPGEKIGVCGRTGAGKSSLIMSLFRIVELCAGRVLVGGVDCATVPLHLLRSRLSIIPQTPALFSGTVRHNLDPASEHTDTDLWRVLDSVELKAFVEAQEMKLEHDVGDGGKQLSVGQRQLICVARALLKPSSILVMDEATASVDPDTDRVIHKAVADAFRHHTIITIAHRLPTIINSDRVLVMDKGSVVEFDSPQRLLENSRSAFFRLVEETGAHSASFLRGQASHASQ